MPGCGERSPVLADVLIWLRARGGYALASEVIDVAAVALRVNATKEGLRISRPVFDEFEALVG